MRARRPTVGVLFLAALLVAGCGSGSGTQRAMEAKFQKLDYQMASIETINSPYDVDQLGRATAHYIRLVRQYAQQLGPAEAKRRLLQKSDELSAYCLPCVATLEDAARKY